MDSPDAALPTYKECRFFLIGFSYVPADSVASKQWERAIASHILSRNRIPCGHSEDKAVGNGRPFAGSAHSRTSLNIAASSSITFATSASISSNDRTGSGT